MTRREEFLFNSKEWINGQIGNWIFFFFLCCVIHSFSEYSWKTSSLFFPSFHSPWFDSQPSTQESRDNRSKQMEDREVKSRNWWWWPWLKRCDVYSIEKSHLHFHVRFTTRHDNDCMTSRMELFLSLIRNPIVIIMIICRWNSGEVILCRIELFIIISIIIMSLIIPFLFYPNRHHRHLHDDHYDGSLIY